jgi:hypothetical protein
MVTFLGLLILLWGMLNIYRARQGTSIPMKAANTKLIKFLFVLGFIVFPILIGLLLIFTY